MRLMRSTWLAVGVCLVVAPVGAQSLGDLAKAEAARRAALPTTATKVVRDADLKPEPVRVPETPVTPATVASITPPEVVPAVVSPAETAQKTEAYWKDRMRILQTKLDNDVAALAEVTKRLGEYNVMLDDSAQTIQGTTYVSRTVRKKTLDTNDERGRLVTAVQNDKRAISELEEDARRAGVPAGWLRLP